MSALMKEITAEIRKTIRAPAFIIPTLLFPVLFYTIFGVLVSGGSPQQATYLLATYGVFAAMGPALFGFGVGLSLEREKGWLDLKRVMPMSPTNYLIAKLIAAIVTGGAAILLIYGVAIMLGGVRLPYGQWAMLFLVHVAATIPFGLLGLTVGMLLKGQAAMAITNVLNLGLALLGGLWMPLQFFPDVMQKMANYLPSFHAGSMALNVIEVGEGNMLFNLMWIVIFTALFAVIAIFSWGLQRR